jgi:hypothetical protein
MNKNGEANATFRTANERFISKSGIQVNQE